MSALFVWLWIAGGAPAAVLGEVVRAESPRVARAGRIAFALLLGGDLLLAALFFSLGNSAPAVHATRGIWWVSIVLGGVPLALVSGLAVRRGYGGRRLVLAAAALTTAALYLAFPLGFIPATDPLTGLGRFEHDHHALDIAILLVPSLILLANEVGWKREGAPDAEADSPDSGSRARVLSRPGTLAVTVLLLVVLIWAAGANGYGLLIALGVVVVGGGLFLWQRNFSEVRGVLRDLEPPDKP